MSTTVVTKEQKNMLAKEIGAMEKKDLKPGDRIYYGIPSWRGSESRDTKGNPMYNCGPYVVPLTQNLLEAVEASPVGYAEFLQDFFYRSFMEYENHYFRKPTSEVNIRIYNKIADESGHPDWKIPMVSTNTNSESKSEPKKNVSTTITAPAVVPNFGDVIQTVVEVLDKGGNVVASDVCVPAEKKDDKSPVNQSKESKNSDKKKDKKPKTQPENKPDKAPVTFSEKSDQPFVDKDREDGYTEHNQKILAKYPKVAEVIDALKAKGLYCKADNHHGLVKLFTYKPGVAEGQYIIIDPAKIKKHYSIILPSDKDEVNPLYPFYNIFIQFGTEYYTKYVNGEMPNIAELAILAEQSRVDDTFYHHISYGSIPEKDFDYVKGILDPIVAAITQSGLNIRFKVIENEYASKFSFTLITGVKEGLSFFAKDNANYDGLRLEVKVASESMVLLTVSGTNAQEFRDRMFQASNGAIDMKVRKSSPKKENKKPESKKPVGKPEKQEKKPDQQKTETPKTEEKKSESPKKDDKKSETSDGKPSTGDIVTKIAEILGEMINITKE